MTPCIPADLSQLSHEQKDALIIALLAEIEAQKAANAALSARLAELEARLKQPPKTPDNSSTPPSRGQKGNRPAKVKREGPRAGSLGRQGGGRRLALEPDQFVVAKPTHCRHCGAALPAGDHALHGRYDKIDLPPVRPVVTRVERYAGRCPGCGGVTVAPVPEGLEEGTLFGPGIVAAALYLRFVHALSYQRLTRLFRDLFGVAVSEGALDNLFQRAKQHVDREVGAILARLRRSRVICSDETTVRINGRTCWNWVFHNATVVLHVVRPTRAAAVVGEVLDGHRPALWVSDLYGGQRGHADLWQVCLAHQLRDCRYAIEAGDAVFAPRMKRVLLRAVVLARRRHDLAASTRREYRRKLDRDPGLCRGRLSMRSWLSFPRTGTASACANATPRSETTSSPSSIIPRFHPTTTAPSGNCGRRQPIARSPAASVLTGAPISSPGSNPSSAPPPVTASTLIRPSAKPYAAGPSSIRVEQLR
jgi:transposase